ncbi:hypothetical protein [Massilia sp. Root133]|uniref:hypothetical protein n=1 Tax=Massilia sp. Root133 TaxID=1736455 RepID=UPI000A7DDF5D|nr:hypothetical protein [Massilia sp. Root133]
MTLATLNHGALDRQFAVVARELKIVHIADGTVPTLQRVKGEEVRRPADFANI